MADQFVVVFILVSFLSLGVSFEALSLDISNCEQACESGVLQSTACKRGCRFFSMINLINDFADLNDTLDACTISCDEAHNLPECRSSCYTGCRTQLPQTEAYRQQMEVLRAPLAYYASPFAYMNQLYADAVGQVHSKFSVSWSVYVQPDRGTMVIIRSEPAIQLPDLDLEYSEGNALNPEAKGNSFVGDVKSSPLHLEERSVELSPGEGGRVGDMDRSDWLACVSRRTGVPRLLLSLLLIISSVTIVWLCLTTSVSTKHRHLPVEKLSIHFDLDYLKSANDDNNDLLPYLTKANAQDLRAVATPLPIKIKLDTV